MDFYYIEFLVFRGTYFWLYKNIEEKIRMLRKQKGKDAQVERD